MNVNMNMQTWFTSIVICLVLGFISKAPCLGQQEHNVAATANDDIQDLYEDDYYDENELANGGPDPLTDTPNDPPYFAETEIKISAYPNSDVLMNCDVRNFHVNNVVMWYKDSTVIVNGQYSMNARYESLKNNSILLRNVQPSDAGDYYCAVLPQNVTLDITLIVEREALTIRCDGRDVLNRPIVYRQGESHTCECKSPRTAASNIKWYLNGRRSSEVELDVEQDSIILYSIDEQHNGIYQCLDDDGSANPLHGMFEVVVHYAPKVSTHRHHVNTEFGGTAELYCDYRGDPISVTRWLKSNQVLSYSEKYMITYATEQHFNRSTLTVLDVTLEDLGEYKCQAENSIGSSVLRVHLMLEPEKGQFENIKIDGNIVTLHWLVRSLQPLSEAVLDYKMTGAYTWSSTTVLHTQRHEGGIWKVTHEMELLPGEWQTRMKTKNTMGWSKFSTPYIFTIYDEDESNNANDNVNASDKVLVAGFGGGDMDGSGQSGSPSTTNSLPRNAVLLILLAAVLKVKII